MDSRCTVEQVPFRRTTSISSSEGARIVEITVKGGARPALEEVRWLVPVEDVCTFCHGLQTYTWIDLAAGVLVIVSGT